MPPMTTDVVGILRRTDLLRSVPPADLEAVAAASRVRTFRRGQVVFSTGDPGDTLIVVISGRLKVVVRSADGSELTLSSPSIPPGSTIVSVSSLPSAERTTTLRRPEMTTIKVSPGSPVLNTT